MRRAFAALLFCLALPALAKGQVHEYTLDNGLKVIVKQDRRAPIVVSQVWYKVGSSYEPGGVTGVSHVLEHMMFKGTKAHPPGEFSRIIAANGGSENAFTGRDYTAYFQTLSKDRLQVAFELEADRMRNLTLPAEEFAKEIEVVKEERRMRTEDKPTSLTYEQLTAVSYRSLPYAHPVIGWMNDLENMTVEDLRQWYKRWYAPNNATLVVVGDDHFAISSAMAHQSEQLFASWMMPVLHASSISEILEYGLLGWAMSRFSGCYVGLKIESEIIESASSVYVDSDRPAITLPDFNLPPGGLHYRWPYRQLENEARLQNFKLPAALAFARANAIDRVMLASSHPRIGIVTTGKAYRAVRQALDDLGVDEACAQHMGLSIYKVGMPWPLETVGARSLRCR